MSSIFQRSRKVFQWQFKFISKASCMRIWSLTSFASLDCARVCLQLTLEVLIPIKVVLLNVLVLGQNPRPEGGEGSESFDRLYFRPPYNEIQPMLILSLNMLWRGRRVLITQQLDLQLRMQSVPITTNVVRSNPTQAIQHYVIKFVSDLRQD